MALLTQADLVFYGVNTLAFVVLLLLSALISGSEVGLFSLTREEIERCRNGNTQAEKSIVYLLENPKMALATILICNNLVNVSIVTLATYLTWQITGSKNNEGFVIFLLTITVTALILFFGEILPKVYSNKQGFSFVKKTAPALHITQRLLMPLSHSLVSTGNFIETRLQKKTYNFSVDELESAINIATKAGNSSEKEREILKGIVNFSSTTAKQIMTPRLNISAIDIQTNFTELIQEVTETGYSRVPVYRDTVDHIVGVLYTKDLLPFLEAHANFKWDVLLRDCFFIPQNKKIDKLLKDFQEKHVHLAVVVDEYGGTAGIVTLEDIIEEIVGDINDETDDEEHNILYTRIDDNSYVFQSKIFLNHFCKIMRVSPGFFDEIKGESESLNGLLLELFARIPSANEQITYQHFTFTIALADIKRVKLVKVEVHLPEADYEEEE